MTNGINDTKATYVVSAAKKNCEKSSTTPTHWRYATPPGAEGGGE